MCGDVCLWTQRNGVFHGVLGGPWEAAKSHRPGSASSRAGGMTDAQIRDKVKRADQTGKSKRGELTGRRQNMEIALI